MSTVQNQSLNITLPESNSVECIYFCGALIKMSDTHERGRMPEARWALERFRDHRQEAENFAKAQKLADEQNKAIYTEFVSHRSAVRGFHKMVLGVATLPDPDETGIPAQAQTLIDKAYGEGLGFLTRPSFQMYMESKFRIDLAGELFLPPLTQELGQFAFNMMRTTNDRLGSALHLRGEITPEAPENLSDYITPLRESARVYVGLVSMVGQKDEASGELARLLLQPLMAWQEMAKKRHVAPRVVTPDGDGSANAPATPGANPPAGGNPPAGANPPAGSNQGPASGAATPPAQTNGNDTSGADTTGSATDTANPNPACPPSPQTSNNSSTPETSAAPARIELARVWVSKEDVARSS